MKSYALIIFKPDALEAELVETILARFIAVGFQIEMTGFKKVSEQLILTHYAEVVEKLGKPFQEMAITAFVGKTMLPIILSQEGTDAISNSRKLTGATDPNAALKGTIRGDFGADSFAKADLEGRCCNNLIHCSDSLEAVLVETKLWFAPETYDYFFQLINRGC